MIVVNNPEHAERIAEAARVMFNHAADQCISRVDENGELMGGVVFTGYNRGGSIALHMAGFAPAWPSPELMRAVFGYCFDQLQVKKAFALVPSDNLKALEIDRRMGFKDEVVIPEVFADSDLVVLSMRRDECRWLRNHPREVTDGRQSRGPSPA